MRVRVSPPAMIRLTEIGEHTTALYGKRKARAVGATLERIIMHDLPLFPLRGREGRVTGTREITLTQLPFTIVYRIVGDTIEILTILHQAQRWPRE